MTNSTVLTLVVAIFAFLLLNARRPDGDLRSTNDETNENQKQRKREWTRKQAATLFYIFLRRFSSFRSFDRIARGRREDERSRGKVRYFHVGRFIRKYQRFGMVHPTAVVHIQLQPVSPGIWHVVSQRSQPDSPSDSWRITVIACLWSLTSSWSHNYRMASRSINERHRRCCTRRARSTRPCACMRISLSSGTFE